MKGLALAALAALIVTLPAAGMAEGESMGGVTVSISSGEELTTHSVVRSPGSPVFQMEAMRIVPRDDALAREAFVGERFEQRFVVSLDELECDWTIDGLSPESGLELELETDSSQSTSSAILSGTPQEADEGVLRITITAIDGYDENRRAQFTFELEVMGS